MLNFICGFPVTPTEVKQALKNCPWKVVFACGESVVYEFQKYGVLHRVTVYCSKHYDGRQPYLEIFKIEK